MRGLLNGPQPLQASRPIGVFANEPGLSMASSMRGDTSNAATSGTAGGLLGMIQDDMRNNGYSPPGQVVGQI